MIAKLELNLDSVRTLSEKQRRAIEMLLQGVGDAEAGQAVGVDRTTVYRWRTGHPAFRRELTRLQRVVWEQQAERLRAMVRPALDVLQRQLDDPRTAFRAATALLRLGAPKPQEPPSAERQQRDRRREFNRALDAYINAPMPDGSVGPRVSIDDDDDDDCDHDDDELEGEDD
jgi:hypothetical protein